MGVLGQDSELALITKLCRELAKLGLNVGMSDARPAAVIRPRVCAPVWVTVDTSLEFYECPEAGKQYPAADPAGAAALISKAIKGTSAEPEEAP